jgi:hypothetical protein
MSTQELTHAQQARADLLIETTQHIIRLVERSKRDASESTARRIIALVLKMRPSDAELLAAIAEVELEGGLDAFIKGLEESIARDTPA